MSQRINFVREVAVKKKEQQQQHSSLIRKLEKPKGSTSGSHCVCTAFTVTSEPCHRWGLRAEKPAIAAARGSSRLQESRNVLIYSFLIGQLAAKASFCIAGLRSRPKALHRAQSFLFHGNKRLFRKAATRASHKEPQRLSTLACVGVGE